MEKKIFEARLETLLLHKDFNDLLAEEKKYVLTLLTEDEYHEYSLLISNYKPALLTDYDHVQPSPQVLVALTQTLRAKHQQKPIVRLTANWRLLSVAAVLLFLIGYVVFFFPFNKKKQPIVAKINKQQPISLPKIVKQEPAPQTYLAKNHFHKSRKPSKSFTVPNDNNNLCLAIDSLADMPCLNPMTTMLTLADPDDDSDGF